MIPASKFRLIATTSLTLAAALTAQASTAQDASMPSGGTVVAGQASIGVPSGSGQTIAQTSQRAVINWNTFNVGSGKTVTFVQPDANAATLNRVTGNTASTIAGQIHANGAVFLINPNGIQITRTGAVSAGRGFVASTLDLANGDFMAGRGTFAGHRGMIDHQGSIAVGQDGYVGLLGGSVNLSGLITAPAGKVVVGAVTHATLDINGDGFLKVALPDGALLSNDGAATLVGTDAAREAVRNAVNLSPFATSNVAGRDGDITLSGRISVDSREGDAGSIVIMGNDTRANGALTARANGVSGNGGFVETSGNHIDVTGLSVDTSAARGQTGIWLVDPSDLTVASAAAATIVSNLATSKVTLQTTATTASGPGLQSNGAGDMVVESATDWAGGNKLTLDAFHDISVNAPIVSSDAGAALVLRADNAGSGKGTVRFGIDGSIAMNGGGTVDIYYNPASYTTPTDFGAHVTGNSTSWMLVNTLDQLEAIRTNLYGSYALNRDIDASETANWYSGAGFEPLGNQGYPFDGQFDGLGHVISSLTVHQSSSEIAGLFGLVAGGTIQNIGLLGGRVTNNTAYTGMLVGLLSSGTINSSYATGIVTGEQAVGGLVGIVTA